MILPPQENGEYVGPKIVALSCTVLAVFREHTYIHTYIHIYKMRVLVIYIDEVKKKVTGMSLGHEWPLFGPVS